MGFSAYRVEKKMETKILSKVVGTCRVLPIPHNSLQPGLVKGSTCPDCKYYPSVAE